MVKRSWLRLTVHSAFAAVMYWATHVYAAAPLEGRTIHGDRVDAYDASAVMIYDPSEDLTWLRDWNSLGYSTDYFRQLDWVWSLRVGEFSGWRLPEAYGVSGYDVFDCVSGYCESELTRLWVNALGNEWGQPRVNSGPFLNVPEYDDYLSSLADSYWLGNSFADDEFGVNVQAVVFRSSIGVSDVLPYFYDGYAVAVRDGDVATPVPELGTLGMMAFGLVAVSAALRRCKPKS